MKTFEFVSINLLEDLVQSLIRISFPIFLIFFSHITKDTLFTHNGIIDPATSGVCARALLNPFVLREEALRAERTTNTIPIWYRTYDRIFTIRGN